MDWWRISKRYSVLVVLCCRQNAVAVHLRCAASQDFKEAACPPRPPPFAQHVDGCEGFHPDKKGATRLIPQQLISAGLVAPIGFSERHRTGGLLRGARAVGRLHHTLSDQPAGCKKALLTSHARRKSRSPVVKVSVQRLNPHLATAISSLRLGVGHLGLP